MARRPSVRQLQYLVAVAEQGHFGRAAEQCSVTQSTLSAGIRELEDVLGTVVLERDHRTIGLTPIGRDLVARARSILGKVDDLVAAAQAGHDPLGGPLQLGVIPTISPFLLPRILPQLRAARPDLKLFLTEDVSDRLVGRLADGALDVVLLALPYEAAGLETEEITPDPFLVACRRDHPIAALSVIDSASLADAPLLLLAEGHCLRDHALAACRLPPRPDRRAFEGTSLHTLVQMVANGLGATLLPKVAVDAGILAGTDVVVRPLFGDASGRSIGLGWRQGSPRAPGFREMARLLRTLDADTRPQGDAHRGA
ncbi:MAG: hydrogen peroxide-inducible genes activator [Rhodospirillaceae bacterium]|nr:hydrogen peroxide-inducible genes activator [Rhodospirillaceae bacterium]